MLEFARHFPATTEVHLCVTGDDLTLLEEFRKTSARVAIIPVRRPWVEWGQLRRVLAYIRAHNVAVINSFDLKTLLVGVAAKLRFGRRIKLVHHLISLWDGLRDHHKQMVWHSLRFADVVVCNGYAVRDTLIGSKKIKPRVVVVPNGVDGEHFRPMPDVHRAQRQRLGLGDDHFVFGTVANVRPVKNYPLLLNTIRRVAEEHPHVRLLCVGGGPQLEEMKALASRLGVGDKVIWTGQTTDIRPFVATFDAFALTSIKEGCPNALMQAMAMGVASMSSAVGEVPHLTESGQCGLLFDPNDEETCVAAALRLVQDASLRARLGAAGRQRMLNHYSPTKMIDNYVTLFEDTAAETG